jgi:hypothetical protein
MAAQQLRIPTVLAIIEVKDQGMRRGLGEGSDLVRTLRGNWGRMTLPLSGRVVSSYHNLPENHLVSRCGSVQHYQPVNNKQPTSQSGPEISKIF